MESCPPKSPFYNRRIILDLHYFHLLRPDLVTGKYGNTSYRFFILQFSAIVIKGEIDGRDTSLMHDLESATNFTSKETHFDLDIHNSGGLLDIVRDLLVL